MIYKKTEDFLTIGRNRKFFHKLCASVSTAILKARINKDMSQKEFAKYMGVSQGMISRWENGNYNFSLEAVADICDKINYEPEMNLEDLSYTTPVTTIKYLSDYEYPIKAEELLIKAG